MCGRFARTKSAEDARRRFHADQITDEGGRTGNDITPAVPVTVIRTDAEGGQRVVDAIGWGFKFPGKPFLNINAKSETALERAWKHDALARRVIIPADAFYEWQHVGKEKTRWHATLETHDVIALAGIARKTSDGPRALILTQAAQQASAWIHHRQPLVLPESVWDDWLDPENNSVEHVAPLLAPTNPPLEWREGLLQA